MASFKGYKRSIIFDFEYSQVTQGTSEINKQMALLNAEFRRASEEVAQTGNSFDKLALTQEKLQTQVKLQADKVAILRKELDEVSKSEGNNEKAIQRKTIELKNAETALLKTNAQLEKVNREVEKSNTSFGRATLAIQDFKNNAEKMNVDLDTTIRQLQGVAVATVAAITGVSKLSMDFDKSFNKVKTIADDTEVSFDDLRKQTLDMSRDLKLANVTANDLADGLYEIISANISTADSMAVLEQSAKLAETGFTDMKTSTDIMTTILNSYKLSVEDASKVTDQLITIQKLGKTTINDLGQDFGRVAGLAATANVPLEEMGGAIAVLTTNGVKSNESITALKAILGAVVKPTKEAADTAQNLGIKFDLTAIKSKGLAGFLADVQRKTRGNDEAMAKLFGSVEALNAMYLLTSQEGLAQFKGATDQIANSTGAADVAMSNLDGSGTRLNDSWANLKTTLIEVGDAFAPIIDFISVIITGLSKINPEIIIAVGTGLLVAKVLTAISAILPVLGASSTIAAAGLTKLGIAGGISAGQIILIASAVALIVGLFAMLSGSSKKAEQDLKSLGNTADSVVKNSLSSAQQTAKQAGRNSYAIGTRYHPGGDAAIHANEEVIIPNLPRGTVVRSAMETTQTTGSGTTYNLNNVTIQTNDAKDLFNQIQILCRTGAI